MFVDSRPELKFRVGCTRCLPFFVCDVGVAMYIAVGGDGDDHDAFCVGL